MKNINIVLFTGGLLTVYMMQGVLYPSGTIISQSILFLILAIGSMCFFRSVLDRNIPTAVAVFAFFILMLTLTYLVSPKIQYGWKYEAIGAVNTFGQFKNTCSFSLLFFIGYYSGMRQNVNWKIISAVFSMLLTVAVIMFFDNKQELMMELTRKGITNREGVTNNAAYGFVVLIPFLPIVMSHIKKKYLIIGVVVFMASLIIMGSKRGAILSMIVSTVFSVFYYLYHIRLDVNKTIGILLMLIVGGVLMFYAIEQNEYLIGRLEKTQTSGIGTRKIAYSVLWDYWNHESSNFAYFFGNGSSASIKVWGNYAHNDWLELLTDNGLLGVVTYALLFFSFFLLIRRSELSPWYRLSMYLCLLIWFLQTCFSMGYTDLVNGTYTLLLGILTGKSINKQNEITADEKNAVID